MTDNTQKYAILSNGYGSYNLYDATIENAKRIFNNYEQYIPEKVKQIANSRQEQEKTTSFYSATLFVNALNNLLKQDTSKLRVLFYGNAPKNEPDERPDVLFNPEWETELKLFLFDSNIQKLSAGNKEQNQKVMEILTFLSPFRNRFEGTTLVFVEDDAYFDGANEYAVIKNEKWKDGVEEIKKIRYIINFVTEWAINRNDINYEVLEIRTTA